MSEGYIKTKIGEIPASWMVANVDDFIVDKKGAMKIGPFGSALKKDTMVPIGIKVYGQENIFENDMTFGDRYIKQSHYEQLKSCELFAGDFIISMMGTIGKCMVVPEDIEKGIMDSHLLRLQLNSKLISSSFLKHQFRSPLVLNQVNNLAVGGIMAGLSSKIVKQIKFTLPPFPEQQKIAEILSTVDEKIDVIDQQISETQALKKGLMQRLLTKGIGHTEFKDSPLGEIPSSWEVRLLEECAKRGSGHTPDKKINSYYNGGVKWVSLGDSNKLDNRYISETKIEISKEGLKNSSAVLHPEGTVLLSRDAGVGKSAVMETKMAVSQHFITWECGAYFSNWFLYYYLQDLKPTFERVAIGSTIKTIGLGFFKKMKIVSPPIIEQNQIADILNSVEDKIDILLEKKTSYQELKKGLMQQLLTGKIRVNGLIKKTAMA